MFQRTSLPPYAAVLAATWLTLGTFIASASISAAADRHETSAGPVDVTALVRELDNPWAVAVLPDGRFLITERSGTLLLIDGKKRREVGGLPEIKAHGQGGLLDVVLAPDYARTGEIYLSFTQPIGLISARTAVARAVLDTDAAKLRDVKVLFHQAEDRRAGRHFGSRIVPDGKGHLWITTGDRGDADFAQANGHLGKVIRIAEDGSVPADNPFIGTPMPDEVWSMGHRNPQGAALDEQGRLWTVSHGARGGDEVNRPEAGKNYGWPVISYGTEYSGGKIGIGVSGPGMEQPVWYWDPSIAPSGMMIYSGKLWPEWAGTIFVGSLKYDFLSRLDRDGDRITGEEELFRDDYIRIRDVREAPDGSILFLAVGDGTLFRMTPAR